MNSGPSLSPGRLARGKSGANLQANLDSVVGGLAVLGEILTPLSSHSGFYKEGEKKSNIARA